MGRRGIHRFIAVRLGHGQNPSSQRMPVWNAHESPSLRCPGCSGRSSSGRWRGSRTWRSSTNSAALAASPRAERRTMPSTLTYPGVYVEEVPSGVRTITPVSTSVTAFVGFTSRGPTDDATQIFGFADFEREFGGLSVDSDLSYAVQHYFQNGGAEAWIVRVAAGAAAAGISLLNQPGGSQVLDVTAPSQGAWGNRIRIDVDYDTSNPASLFNITATEFEEQGGVLTPVRTETHRT